LPRRKDAWENSRNMDPVSWLQFLRDEGTSGPGKLLNLNYNYYIQILLINTNSLIYICYILYRGYSGLQKHCNVLQFQIVCSVALYGMEVTLSIIERKYSTPSWLFNKLYFTQFKLVVVEICPL
jgi:hypothetical protein